MTNIRTSVDGAPDDRVGHELVSQRHVVLYREAVDALRKFDVPILVHAGNPHEKLFIAAFDGTRNNKYSDPVHATNVAKIYDQIHAANRLRNGPVYPLYVEGPGTQQDRLTARVDSIRGSSYRSKINEAYDELVYQANRWNRNDPEAVIRVHAIGFSRGASQVPGFARLVHEKGIPDLDSEVRGPNGIFEYERYIARPGEITQTVGLFDPVATGAPMNFDRRLPPSVVSGLQLTAADELRASFPSDQIIPPGLSDDGRFLNVMVPGAHSDVGGGYLRDGLSTRCGNLMRSYCNALRDEPYLQKQFEPTDARLNVVHHSNKGVDVFRLDPREGIRGEPSGTNERLAPRHMEHAGPAPHRPESMDSSRHEGFVRQRLELEPVKSMRDLPPSIALEDIAAAGRPVVVGHNVLRAASLVGSIADLGAAGMTAWNTSEAENASGAMSQIVHAGSRNAAGWAGAETFTAAGAALGVESGPGLFVTGAIGGLVGFVAGDKIADAYDQYRIRNQKDPQGHSWTLDDQHGWVRDLPPLPEHPHGQKLIADPILSSRLSYQASNTAVELALATEYKARDPFTQSAAPGDTPSVREAPWTHQAETHQWTREVTDEWLEHGLTRSHRETADTHRAAELDRAAEHTIQQNVAESPVGVAQRYRDAYEQQGWAHHGPMSEAVAYALNAPSDNVLASDGHNYTHGRDGEWSRSVMFFGTSSADGRLREELDASERVAQGLKGSWDAVGLNHQPATPAVPSRLDDPGHPDHAFFKQVREHVAELDKSLGRSPDQYTDNIASALTVQARADGLHRVDEIALSADGKALWATQTPPGRKDHLLDLSTKVPTAEATTPLERSGAKWPEAIEQFQDRELERVQSQQMAQERNQVEIQAQVAPVMEL